MRSLSRRVITSLVAALLLAPANGGSAAAEESVPLPFTPPAWRAMPPGALPNSLATWQNGRSSFGVSALAVPVTLSTIEPSVKTQAEATGTVISASEEPVCEQPAYRIVTNSRAAARF